MAEEKKKVYMVTSGEYSDYHVCGIFSTLEKAEQYAAAQDTNNYCTCDFDRHYIEVVEVDEYTVECETVYKAINFHLGEHNCGWNMIYGLKPFELSIEEYTHWGYGGYKGIIPVEKTFIVYEDDELVTKIVRDHVAQWKAEQAGL